MATGEPADQLASSGSAPTTKHCFVPAGTFTVKVTSARAGHTPSIKAVNRVSNDFFIMYLFLSLLYQIYNTYVIILQK